MALKVAELFAGVGGFRLGLEKNGFKNKFSTMKVDIRDAGQVQDMVDKTTVSDLARLAGIKISDDELDEVTNRFSSLIEEMDRLKDLDLANIHPVAIFPEDGEA